VLTDSQSASASEIVAGALKNHHRALIIGQQTFGKGSVQVIYQIDDAALKLTIAQYLTPGDISIQSVGIAPDVEIHTLRVSRDYVDLVPDQLGRRGEAGLDKHLEHSSATKGEATIRLRLLHVTEAKAEGGDKDVTPEEAEGFKPDELTQLARDLLIAAPHPSRKAALLQAAPVLAARQAEEELALSAHLETLDVDWTMGEFPKRTKATLTLDVLDEEGKPLTRAVAGKKIRLRATVTARGTLGLWRLHGNLHSELGVLDGREFVFGRVAPGETKTWETEVELPMSLDTQADRLVLELLSAGRDTGVEAHLILEILGLPQPRFATSIRVDDEEGNRDGLVQRGESIRLAVDVENLGPGDADNVLVTLKNESGDQVYIRSGRHRVGELAAGASSTSIFSLDVRAGLSAQDVQLQLTVVDQTLRTWMQHDVSLPVFPDEFPPGRDVSGTLQIGDQAATVHAGAHTDTPILGTLAAGAIVSTVRQAGEWSLLSLPSLGTEAPSGWIQHKGHATPASGGTTPDAFTAADRRAPPALELDPSIFAEGALVTAESTFEVGGTARYAPSERGRRYVYIFRGDDKVFFRAGEPGSSNRDLPFKTSVSLVPGRNVLSVIARQGERDVTRRSVVIYRDAGSQEK
jgi:carboxyl-terminal processing protease